MPLAIRAEAGCRQCLFLPRDMAWGVTHAERESGDISVAFGMVCAMGEAAAGVPTRPVCIKHFAFCTMLRSRHCNCVQCLDCKKGTILEHSWGSVHLSGFPSLTQRLWESHSSAGWKCWAVEFSSVAPMMHRGGHKAMSSCSPAAWGEGPVQSRFPGEDAA